MKCYAVIWTEDVEHFEGRGCKSAAFKRAKEIYLSGQDNMVFVQRVDDDNPDGYCAGEPSWFIKDLKYI